MMKVNDKIFLDGEFGENLSIIVDGEEVGYINAIHQYEDDPTDDRPLYVEYIEVYDGHKNQGIGTAVLNFVASEWWSGIILAPTDEDNQRLYERLGAEEDNSVDADQGFGVYLLDK